jgi:predicted outer membrane lipoprotein
MIQQKHPTIQKSLQRFFWPAWTLAAVLFACGLYSLKNGFTILGWTLSCAFGIVVAVTLIYTRYRLHNVQCPACGQKMRTSKDVGRSWLVAQCNNCGIQWDLAPYDNS